MNLHLISDIHLECLEDDYDLNKFVSGPNNNNSILVLCGDVCSIYLYDKLKEFLKHVCNMFKHVIYVPGNNEFYKIQGIKPQNYIELCKQLDKYSEDFSNLHILNNSCIQIESYLFCGSILWTQTNILPKYFRIHGFDKDIYNRKNKQDTLFIEKCIDYSKTNDLKPIIITHYPPSKICIKNNNDKFDKYKRMYYNDLDYLFENKLVWIYGHTHFNINKKINNTLLVSNQYGKGKNIDDTFKNNFIINI